MGWFNRTILGIYSLCIMILSLAVALMAAVSRTSPLDWLAIALEHRNPRMVIGLVALVFLLISLKFFINSIAGRSEDRQAVIHENALGQVRVTIPAIESLVNKVTASIRGVREVRPRVTCRPEGVVIFVQAAVTPEVSIPQVSEEIQNKVKDYVTEIAGVNVANVKILVDSISGDSKDRAHKLN